MLIDLVPSFLEATLAPDPVDGYRRYFEEHHPVLSSYWRNYVLDPDSSPAEEEETPRAPRQPRGPSDDEVDRVLDKISATGLDSLTPKERELLVKRSERPRQR